MDQPRSDKFHVLKKGFEKDLERGFSSSTLGVCSGITKFAAMKLHAHIITMTAVLVLMTGAAEDVCAQVWRQKNSKGERNEVTVREEGMKKETDMTSRYKIGADGRVTLNAQVQGEVLEYIIEDGDTIFMDEIRASKVYSRLPKQKGKEWRKYYKLVHNFSKSYPYALVAKKLVMEADSTISADRLKGARKEKYVSEVQKELFEVFEGQMRNLTVSQGALLMKLVDREVGKSSYNIIKDYKSGIAAGFWQGIAKMFGSDLKKPYDPEGEDKQVEELVQIWEAGDYPAFYWSLFWKDMPEVVIPEKYL